MKKSSSLRKDKIISTSSSLENKEIKIKSYDTERVGFFNVATYFSEDIWDFFSEIHYVYKIYVKQIILEYLLNDNQVSTIQKYLMALRKIIRFLEDNHIYDCELITENTLNKFNEYINMILKTENERIRYRRLFSKLMTHIETDRGVDYSNLIKILSKNDTGLLKAQIEEGKTPSIPEEILDRIISCALLELYDDSLTVKEKKEACSVILLSQIGMRISELCLLKAYKKMKIDCFNGEKSISYLEFKSFKTAKDKKGIYTKSFLTDKAELAYSILEELTKSERERYKTGYIFVSSNLLPVGTATMTNWISRFIVRNADKIGLINKEYDGFKIFTKEYNEKHRKINKEYCQNLKENDFISIPKPHQFRVALCNKLIKEEGIEIGWVTEHMNHLSIEMTMHYIRETHGSEKTKNVTREVFKGIINKEFKLIGEEAELLVNKINEFISKNKYNIKENLDEIITALSGEIPIREKREGYCIKSAFGKKCKYNEFLCAFEMCPNHCTNYLFSDITYNRFKEHKKVIEYNMENNFIREANMEKNKLKRMASLYLIKELNELKDEINR